MKKDHQKAGAENLPSDHAPLPKSRTGKSMNRWLTLWFIGILLMTLLVSIGWNYYSTWKSILNREESEAQSCATIISGMLDHYGIDALLDRSEDGIVHQLRNPVRLFCQGFRLNLVMILRFDPETQTVTDLMNVFTDDETDELMKEAEGSVIEMDDELRTIFEKLFSGEESSHRDVSKDEVLWYIPYRQASVPTLICMQSNIHVESGLIMREFLMDIVLPIATMTLGFLGLLFLVRRRVIRPLRVISDSMNAFARDSRQKPAPLNIRYQDEIGEIAGSYEKMTEDISAYVNSIEALTREQVQTNVQLEVARRIQYGMVPEHFRLENDQFTICATTRPAKAVGGDFYDCFLLDESNVCVFMGDVSGKGVSAAIFMAMAKTIIREKLRVGLSPADALNQANAELYAQNPEGLFATAFAAILNQGTGELRYANAGHTLPILLKEGAEYLHPDSGIALGMFDTAEILDERITLSPGEGLLLYTDGITEAVDRQKTFYGMERLLSVVSVLPDESAPAEEMTIRIVRDVGTFCDGNEPFDDMAVLVLFRRKEVPSPARHEALRSKMDSVSAWQKIPVDVSSFDLIKSAVFDVADDTPETRKALLACDEALANIVQHSGAKTLSFSCEMHGDELRFSFADDGIPFDPAAALPEEKDFDLLDQGGMGLNLIRQSVSSLRYERKDNRNILTMIF